MKKGCRPFSDSELRAMEKQLRPGKWGLRNVAMFVMGWQTGLRISELLALRLADVVEGNMLNHDILIRKEYRKRKPESMRVYLPPQAKHALGAWVWKLHDLGYRVAYNYVFQSSAKADRPISRSYAWRLIREAAAAQGIRGEIGTHSMRKTFALKFYEHCKARKEQGEALDPLVETQEALGHENVESTIKYLGLRHANTRRLCMEVFG